MAKNNRTEAKFEFNKEQKELSRLILERNDEGKIVLCEGEAGTGKNFAAVWSCIKKKEDLQHIDLYYTRAVVGVDEEEIGFLPGEVDDKFSQYTYPLSDTLDAIVELSDGTYNKNSLKAMWQTAPVTFVRGRTFSQAMVIIDECQNLSYKQLKTLLTRIGRYSTFILLGDPNQIDSKKQNKFKRKYGYCAFEIIMRAFSKKGLEIVHMKEVRRSGMAAMLNDWFKEIEEEYEDLD